MGVGEKGSVKIKIQLLLHHMMEWKQQLWVHKFLSYARMAAGFYTRFGARRIVKNLLESFLSDVGSFGKIITVPISCLLQKQNNSVSRKHGNKK